MNKGVTIFTNPESNLRLVTVHLIKYSEDFSITKTYLSKGSLLYWKSGGMTWDAESEVENKN